MKNKTISRTDLINYKSIRNNISNFLQECSDKYDKNGKVLLDIAPQTHEGACTYFKKTINYTLDIDPKSKATYIADICKENKEVIRNNFFDFIVCTEVLEHTLNPFAAIKEMHRILKVGGLLFISTPFNFRIHGPLPDCWRFTEYGLRELLKQFSVLIIDQIETKDRWLMPVHYTAIAQKDKKYVGDKK